MDDRSDLSISVVLPFANPHLLSIFRVMQERHPVSISPYVFRDLPEQRRSLGWATPDDVIRIPESLRNLSKFIRSVKNSDHVVLLGVADPKLMMPLVLVACRCLRKPIWIASEGFKHRGRKFPFILRSFLNSPTVSILAIGDGSANDYRNAGIDRARFLKFGFAEQYEEGDLKHQASRDAILERGNHVTVLGVGQLTDRKNFESVVNALASLDVAQSVELRLCGDGVNRDSLVRQAKTLNANMNLSLLGNLSVPELRKQFELADIFVMPSRYDGWGVVLNQALHHHLPCVVSRSVRAANQHLVEHGTNGFIYDDIRQLSDYLGQLVRNEALRSQFARASVEIAKSWSVENLADRLYRIMSGADEDFSEGPLQVE